MKVGAVIVNYNAGRTIERSLGSLDGESRIHQVVVVDNASADGSWQLVPEEVLVRNDQNLGFAKAVNQAVALLENHDAILLLNPDAWLLPGALEKMEQALVSGSDVGAVGPKNLYEDGQFAYTGWRFPTFLVTLLLEVRVGRVLPQRIRQRLLMSYYLPQSGPPVRVDWVFGSCVLIRREMWEDVGGLDESFFMFGEELDMFWRAAKRGWKVMFVPEAEIVHVGGMSASEALGEREYDDMRWRQTDVVTRRHLSYPHFIALRALNRGRRWMWKRKKQSDGSIEKDPR